VARSSTLGTILHLLGPTLATRSQRAPRALALLRRVRTASSRGHKAYALWHSLAVCHRLSSACAVLVQGHGDAQTSADPTAVWPGMHSTAWAGYHRHCLSCSWFTATYSAALCTSCCLFSRGEKCTLCWARACTQCSSMCHSKLNTHSGTFLVLGVLLLSCCCPACAVQVVVVASTPGVHCCSRRRVCQPLTGKAYVTVTVSTVSALSGVIMALRGGLQCGESW
jgi:hypothetical protein